MAQGTIVATTSGSGVFTTDYVLELWAGTDQDDTAWLDGGGALDAYPGALTPFQAANSNTTEGTRGIKMVCGRITTAMVNSETMDLTEVVGSETHKLKILAFVLADNSQDGKLTAAAGTGANANRLTFTEAGTSEVPACLWMLCA